MIEYRHLSPVPVFPLTSMKRHFGILRTAVLAGITCLLLAGVETESAGSTPLPDLRHSTAVPTVSADSGLTPNATGGALMLATYGFLIMLRRRSPR